MDDLNNDHNRKKFEEDRYRLDYSRPEFVGDSSSDDDNGQTNTAQGGNPKEKGRDDALVVYIALGSIAVSGFLGWIVAIIYAYMRRDTIKETIYYGHLNYLIRTSWILAITFILGVITAPFLIGFLIIGINFIWYVYRIIKGVLRYKDYQPIKP